MPIPYEEAPKDSVKKEHDMLKALLDSGLLKSFYNEPKVNKNQNIYAEEAPAVNINIQSQKVAPKKQIAKKGKYGYKVESNMEYQPIYSNLVVSKSTAAMKHESKAITGYAGISDSKATVSMKQENPVKEVNWDEFTKQMVHVINYFSVDNYCQLPDYAMAQLIELFVIMVGAVEKKQEIPHFIETLYGYMEREMRKR